MKTIRKDRCAVIQQRDPEAFTEQYNALMDQLAGSGAEVDKPQPYRSGDGFFIVVVTYQEVETIAENIREEYEARGECYFCKDCPDYRPNTDGRKKGGFCKLRTQTYKEAKACLSFYKRLELGEVEGVNNGL